MTSQSESVSDDVIAQAFAARDGAVAPYSRFRVGVAMVDQSGRVWTGANVENSSYNLGLCAERVALYYALTHGGSGFRQVVVATDAARPTPPCGACRQALWEFARDATVLMVTQSGQRKQVTVRDLVPHAFDESHFQPD